MHSVRHEIIRSALALIVFGSAGAGAAILLARRFGEPAGDWWLVGLFAGGAAAALVLDRRLVRLEGATGIRLPSVGLALAALGSLHAGLELSGAPRWSLVASAGLLALAAAGAGRRERRRAAADAAEARELLGAAQDAIAKQSDRAI